MIIVIYCTCISSIFLCTLSDCISTGLVKPVSLSSITNFGTRLSVFLIKGVRLIGGQVNRGFTIYRTVDLLSSDSALQIGVFPRDLVYNWGIMYYM